MVEVVFPSSIEIDVSFPHELVGPTEQQVKYPMDTLNDK